MSVIAGAPMDQRGFTHFVLLVAAELAAVFCIFAGRYSAAGLLRQYGACLPAQAARRLTRTPQVLGPEGSSEGAHNVAYVQ